MAALIVAFSPHRRGILKKNAIVPQKGDEKFPLETGEIKRGVKGKLLLGCLPRWGERGSPSQPLQNEKNMGSKGFPLKTEMMPKGHKHTG